jgi:hypothetical protein
MDKGKILAAVLAELEADLRRQLVANESASAGATHGEARAETKWDTCGLEQSYLARGHAQQFAALAQQTEELRAFSLPSFAEKPIGIGALIETEMAENKMVFFLLKCGGGIEVEIDGQTVSVITPESPVGAALLDKKRGDTYSFRTGTEGKIRQIE